MPLMFLNSWMYSILGIENSRKPKNYENLPSLINSLTYMTSVYPSDFAPILIYFRTTGREGTEHEGVGWGLCRETAWVRVLVPPLVGCVTLCKLHNLSVPLFPRTLSFGFCFGLRRGVCQWQRCLPASCRALLFLFTPDALQTASWSGSSVLPGPTGVGLFQGGLLWRVSPHSIWIPSGPLQCPQPCLFHIHSDVSGPSRGLYIKM